MAKKRKKRTVLVKAHKRKGYWRKGTKVKSHRRRIA